MALQGVHNQARVAGMALPNLARRDFAVGQYGQAETWVGIDRVDALVSEELRGNRS